MERVTQKSVQEALRVSYLNIFTKDLPGIARFYEDLFGFGEIAAQRSPIFRCLDAGSVRIGFNSDTAYELLNIGDRLKDNGVSCYLTVEAASDEEVAALAERALRLGGRVVKQPYDTAYGSRQCVLADPEDNIFRISYTR